MADIKLLQHLLNVQGFTDAKGNKLVEDGIVGQKTLQALAKTVVGFGARGEITRWIQNRLIIKGYSVGSFGADGIFGKDTLTAVKKFQADKFLYVDGLVGIQTWTILVK